MKEVLNEKSNIFADIFSCDTRKFESSDGEIFSRPFVYCTDITELIDRLSLIRGWHITETELLCGFDDGQKMLKQTLTVTYQGEEDPDPDIKKRTLRSEGITGGKKFKFSGVNKLIVIAAAPRVPETYENCSVFINATGINSTVFNFAGDLKIINKCLGLMGHSSTYPCCYCEGIIGEWEINSCKRTIENIERNAESLKRSGGERNMAKLYYSCAEKPLLQGSECHKISGETSILLLCPPPMLHIKLGLGNGILSALFDHILELESLLTSKLGIVRADYHGKQYIGKDISKLLRNLDWFKLNLPDEFHTYWNVLNAFK